MRMKNWLRVPDGRLTPRRTGRLIVGRNVTSTSTSMSNLQTRPLVREGATKLQTRNCLK
jgi:hypothetical protein